MSGWTLPREGGCRCGRARFRLTKGPLLTMACHCTGCQKMSSSAYSLSAAIPADGFEVTAGETVIGGLHNEESQHHFCGWCMTWIFTRPKRLGWMVNLRPTMLDDTSGIAPFVETWTSEKLPFAQTAAVHSFEGYPPMEAVQGLMAQYAEWVGAQTGASRAG